MNNNNYGNHTTSKINIKIENNIKKKKKKTLVHDNKSSNLEHNHDEQGYAA